jgi:hypothetical protein
MRCARKVSANSFTWDSGSVFEVSERYRIGLSAGFCFRYRGGSMSDGRSGCAEAIAAWTSCAAASMSRSRVNWSWMLVCPTLLVEVITSMPAIVENSRSSGVATADAMVSGLAPGSDAFTLIVGKSTFGRSLTGNRR